MKNYKEVIVAKYKDRIDKYLSVNTNFSRSDIKKLIKFHSVFVNTISIRKPNFQIKEKDVILITKIISKKMNAKPENIKLDIIYEDDNLIVINKKSGMVVHPAPGHTSGTLVNALLYKFKNLSDINGPIRPGIVHRIDKDTSGLLVVAKNNETHKFLALQLKKHLIKRTYHALVEGKMEYEKIHINLPIGRDSKHRQKMSVTRLNSKNAITHIFVEKIMENTSFVRCELETGRTHQIRVHLQHTKHSIVGDPIYGKKIDKFGQRLHASKLEFINPKTKKQMIFNSPLPKEFKLSF